MKHHEQTRGCEQRQAPAVSIDEPACSLLTPELATSAIGGFVTPQATKLKNTCTYLSLEGAAPEGLSLLLYYGKTAVAAFEDAISHQGTAVTSSATPAGAAKFTKIRVGGLPAYWNSTEEYSGSLSAVDGEYVLHVTTQGPDGQSIAKAALVGIEKRI